MSKVNPFEKEYKVTLKDYKSYYDIPSRIWSKVDIPNGNIISLKLKYLKKGIDITLGKTYQDKPLLIKADEKYFEVFMPKRKELIDNPKVYNYSNRLLHLKEPYSPIDLIAIREGEVINYLANKYGPFMFLDGDNLLRYGTNKTTIVCNGKKITAPLDMVFYDDLEVFSNKRTYHVSAETYLKENAKLLYNIICDLDNNGQESISIKIDEDVDKKLVASLITKRTNVLASFDEYNDALVLTLH